jgi:putative selenate reductase
VATAEPRYAKAKNSKPPRKIGSHLTLFNCITCDKCIPVCPNDANFALAIDAETVPILELSHDGGRWRAETTGQLVFDQQHQIANFADFCNDCGNCDVFCPEDGGPYVVKPRFFLRESDWRESRELDGFQITRGEKGDTILARFDGREYRLEVREERYAFSGEGFRVTFDGAAPETTVTGDGPEEVDLTYCFIMDWMRRAVLDAATVNYVNGSLDAAGSDERVAH